jgi:pimeloyl-ACP methyl ester carboxylesterase
MKMTARDSRLVTATIAAALFVALAQPGFGEGLKYKPITVKTPDGLTISAQEWGNPAGPEILFLIGDNLKNLPLMASEDLVTNITATRTFLHGCFSRQPSANDYETMLAFNMMVPPKVRAGLSGRPLDATEMMSRLKLPVLVTHGAEDRNAKLGAGQYTASVIPGAKLSVYEGVGHSPFYEDAPRFNTELAAFVRAAAAKTD